MRDVIWLFVKLGTIAFGGPAAHIAMMEDEVVNRRRWLTREQFLDYLGATNLIPGPNSTELAIHIGYLRAGWAGLIAAGVSFILPAATIVSAIAVVYVRYGSLPAIEGVLYGVKPVVMAVIAQAIWNLARAALKTLTLGVIGLVAIAATVAGVHELVLLAASGLAMAAIAAAAKKGRNAETLGGIATAWSAAALGAATAAPFALSTLFLVFLKAGAVLFGSGYVLIAFIRADLVERLGWLTESQLLDAIAVGQITPGPVFTTATFVGYVLGGGAGALVATIGIFLPAFVFVALSGPLVPRVRSSPVAGAVLDGVNVASLALMAVVSWQVGRAAIIDLVTAALALVSLIALVRWRVNSAWLILAGAVLGWLAR